MLLRHASSSAIALVLNCSWRSALLEVFNFLMSTHIVYANHLVVDAEKKHNVPDANDTD